MQKLICISGIRLGEEYELPEGDSTMGRSMQNDICILDTESSRYHCKIVNKAGTLNIEDMNSTNGVLLNNNLVVGCAVIRPGDLLKVGNTTYQVYDPYSTTSDFSAASRALLNKAEPTDENLLEKTTLQITKTVTIPKVQTKQKKGLSFFVNEE